MVFNPQSGVFIYPELVEGFLLASTKQGIPFIDFCAKVCYYYISKNLTIVSIKRS